MIPIFGGSFQRADRRANIRLQHEAIVGSSLMWLKEGWTSSNDYRSKYHRLSELTASAMGQCGSSNHTYCIIFEDDAVFHPQFEAEWNATASMLPPHWDVFHLCPGYLYGRMLRNTSAYFNLNPETPPAPASAESRFFTWHESSGYPGGPVAFIIRPHSALRAKTLLEASIKQHPGLSPDAQFSVSLWPLSLRARQPQFCHEMLDGNGQYSSTLV